MDPSPSSLRRADPLLFTLLLWMAVSAARYWWVSIRCVMDGPAFQWGDSMGTATVGGNGISGDFPILVLFTGFLLAMLDIGWRGGQRPFGAMAVGWFGLHLANALVDLSQGGVIFYGDTAGIRFNLTWLSIAVNGGGLLLASAWAIRVARPHTIPQASPSLPHRRRWLLLALALVPVQFALLRFGPQHGITDVIGLLATIGQWVVLNAAWAQRQKASSPTPV